MAWKALADWKVDPGHREGTQGSPIFRERQEEYRICKNTLKYAIHHSKRNCFLELCDSLEHDHWGSAYRIVFWLSRVPRISIALSLQPKKFAALFTKCLDDVVQPTVQATADSASRCTDSCFCTVSEGAAVVVAGTIPVDLSARAQNRILWQQHPQHSRTMAGELTHRLIPNLEPWLRRRLLQRKSQCRSSHELDPNGRDQTRVHAEESIQLGCGS